MAYDSDKKPSGLTALGSLETNDTIIVGDTSDANEVVKTISWANLISLIEALTSYFNVSSDTSDAITEGTTNYFLTSGEKTIIGNTSGTNTGDQDLSTYQLKPSEGAFANGDKTKLDGIETGADVTDTTNVTAAGALMDSEVTNLAQVKAFNSADYATAAQGSTADTALQNITGENLTDLADVDTDKSKTPADGDVLTFDGTDWNAETPAGGGGSVDTSGTPVANDFARFTDADTIEGRSYAEVKADLDLEIGTDVQAYDAGLQSIAGLTTAADRMIYTTASDTYAVATLTSAARSILDDASTTAIRTTLGVGTGDSPQFTAVNIGNATDTTITRTAAGTIAVEGNVIYRAGGTDVPVADGGTGASTAAGAFSNLKQTASTTATGVVELATDAEFTTGTDATRYVTADQVASVEQTMTNKTLTDAKIHGAINTQTGTTYTLVLADASKHVTMSNASANTLTVPPNSSVAFATGTRIMVQQKGAGSTTIAAGAGVTINAPSTVTLAIGEQYESRGLLKTATDTWELI